MWRTAGLLAGLLLAVGASGCSRFEPEEYRPYAPGAEIRAWWDEDVACSGRQGNFDRIRWFVVPGESFECPGGTCVALPSGTSVCARFCGGGQECPQGFACLTLTTGGSACVPADRSCTGKCP